MTLTREGEYITITVGTEPETMHIGEWSKLTSRPGKLVNFSFARGTPDSFSTDEYVEPPCA